MLFSGERHLVARDTHLSYHRGTRCHANAAFCGKRCWRCHECALGQGAGTLIRPSRLRQTADIAGAGAYECTALVLLNRMGDPADGATDNEQREGTVRRQPQSGNGRGEREIDIGVTAGQAGPGRGGRFDQIAGFGQHSGDRVEDCRARGSPSG